MSEEIIAQGDPEVEEVEETTPEVEETETVPETTEEVKEESFNKQALLDDLYKERSRRKELQAQITELSTKVEEMDTLKADHDNLQKRYDRLEALLLAGGDTLAKVLDSRSFSDRLFSTDDDVKDILTDYRKANPTATSAALKSSGDVPGSKKASMNDLLRAASK